MTTVAQQYAWRAKSIEAGEAKEPKRAWIIETDDAGVQTILTMGMADAGNRELIAYASEAATAMVGVIAGMNAQASN